MVVVVTQLSHLSYASRKSKYFLLFVDDFNRKVWINSLKQKSEFCS